MPTFNADDEVEIAYRSYGRGPHTLLLIHGWMVSGAVFSSLLEVMDLTGLRVLVPDLRGSGASGKPERDYNLARYARDVVTLAEVEQLDSFALLGHSMGAQIAQLVAIAESDRVSALVSLCGVPAAGATLPEGVLPGFCAAAQQRAARAANVDAVCKRLGADDRSRLLEDSDRVSPACIAQSFEAWSRGGFAERLNLIEAPTLVVATDDPTLPLGLVREASAAPIARSRLVYLPGPGHYPQLESPRETAALLSAFFAGLHA